MMTLHAVACLATLATGTPAMKGDGEVPELVKAVRASNTFTFKLINAVVASKDKNVLLSAFSVGTVMGMLIQGTQGPDQQVLLHGIAPGLSATEATHGYG